MHTVMHIPDTLQLPEREDEYPVDGNKIDLYHLKNINMLLIADKRLYTLYDK